MITKLKMVPVAILACTCLCGCKAITEKNEQADALAKTILELAAQNQADKIYDQFGCVEFKKDVSRKDWAEAVKKLSSLGNMKSLTRTSFEIETKNDLTRGEYAYKAEWENKSGTFNLSTKWEDGQCKIWAIKYEAK